MPVCDMNHCGRQATKIVAWNNGESPGGGMIFIQLLCDDCATRTVAYEKTERPIADVTVEENK